MQPDQKERVLKYLEDALIACKELYKYRNEKLEMFDVKMNKWAIERGLEIISEALKRAVNIQPDLPISNLTKIFGMRNKIAHEYDTVFFSFIYSYKKGHPITRK